MYVKVTTPTSHTGADINMQSGAKKHRPIKMLRSQHWCIS